MQVTRHLVSLFNHQTKPQQRPPFATIHHPGVGYTITHVGCQEGVVIEGGAGGTCGKPVYGSVAA
jgi:hypothetical protein